MEWQGTQIEIIRREIVSRPVGGASAFGPFLRRLDHTGHADRDFGLEVKDVFERAVVAVSPEVRASLSLDQLPGDAHPPAGFAHRAFEHIADAELAADLLHVDGLALVREARITGDDKEPTDARERGDDLLDHA